MHRIQKLAIVAALAAASAAAAEERTPITFSKPAEKRAGCVGEEMRLPADVQARLPRQVDVWFTVSDTGAVRDIRTGDVSLPLATQIRGALSRCAFTPAADERGVPMTVAVVMPVRFALQPPSDWTPFSPEVARAEAQPLRVVALARR